MSKQSFGSDRRQFLNSPMSLYMYYTEDDRSCLVFHVFIVTALTELHEGTWLLVVPHGVWLIVTWLCFAKMLCVAFLIETNTAIWKRFFECIGILKRKQNGSLRPICFVIQLACELILWYCGEDLQSYSTYVCNLHDWN